MPRPRNEPTFTNEKGAIGYDNPRQVIDNKIISETIILKEAKKESAPIANSDVANKKYVDDSSYTPTSKGVLKMGSAIYPTIPGVMLVAAAAVAYTKDRLYYSPIFVEKATTISFYTSEVTTNGGVGSTARLGIYNADTNMMPTTLVTGSEVTIDTSANAIINSAVNITLPAGIYLFAFTCSANTSFRQLRGYSYYDSLLGTSTLGAGVSDMYVARVYAALSTNGEAWTTLGGTNFYHNYLFAVKITAN